MAISAKVGFLLLLIAQNTSKTLILRAAVGGKGKFLYSAAVLATEGLKGTLSILWVLRSGGTPASIARFLKLEWRVFVRVMVPAGIYNCQQMLEFVALARLDAPLFSVIVQTKLLTTALFTWLVLGRQLRRQQIIALVLLMVGVILAQMKDGQQFGGGLGAESTVGVLATIGIATLSGFAAVYTERVLKHAPLAAHSHAQDILPYMQIQMACASLLIIGAFAVASDFGVIIEYGLWHGFDRKAMVAVLSSALGGLIVSAVLKYADSVLKGYATSASVVITACLSAALFGTKLDMHFMLAVVNVTCSIALYSNLGSGQPGPADAAGQLATPPRPDSRPRPGSGLDLEMGESTPARKAG